nr:hypothetical protein WG70_13705 [Burkholderia oklahomensis EO147]
MRSAASEGQLRGRFARPVRSAGDRPAPVGEWQGAPVPVYAITETRLLPAKAQRIIEFLRECLGQ